MLKSYLKSLAGLISLCVMLTLLFLLASCHRSYDGSYEEDEDSTQIALAVKAVIEPFFTNVDDIATYQMRFKSRKAMEETFSQMSPQMLERVSKVVLNKHGSATLEDIVTEYKLNYDVYSNQTEENETPPKTPSTDIEVDSTIKQSGHPKTEE